MDLIYSRVSKEAETLQDLEVQEEKLIEKFKLENPKILRERGSAYDMKKFSKRTEFIRIIKHCFSSDDTRILDIFNNTHKKRNIRLFVWDSARLMRNVEYSLLFLLLSDLFDVQIYTYKDGNLRQNSKETPSAKLLRYMILAIHSYSGEEYSYTTSENIKKAFITREGIAYSRDGNKIGRKFTRADGTKFDMTYEEVLAFNEKIIKYHKYYQKKGQSRYYPKLISMVKRKLEVIISTPYVSKLVLKYEKSKTRKDN